MTTPINVALTVRSESIQQAYTSYRADRYRVNRRYQRKLVWSVEEKQRLVDSIVLALPLPLFLVAEASGAADAPLELIDGMQRLNAIFSFIEQEFDYEGSYFDLDTLADTKALKDAGRLVQKQPILERAKSVAFANYSLALSVFRADEQSAVDEVFRRINSGGRRLSRQELRQAGTVSSLADLVRKLASRVRGDTSPDDAVPLRKMPQLSISNKNLPYGVLADDIFWVKQNILRREDVRESLDEQVILDLLIDCLIEPTSTSGPKTRDDYYSFSSEVSDRETESSIKITNAISMYGGERIERDFLAVYDSIRSIVDAAPKRFSPLVGVSPSGRGARYYHALFLGMFELMFKDNPRRSVHDIPGLVGKVAGIATAANITSGGDWTAPVKRQTVDAFKGILSPAMQEVSDHEEDPARFGWTSHLETLLTNALVEQQLFDCKQGLYTLSPSARTFDNGALDKIVRTLTAIANMGSSHSGYVVLGIANDEDDARRVKAVDGVTAAVYRGFYIVGISREVLIRGGDLNSYWTWILQKISTHTKVPPEFARAIARDARLVPYRADCAVGILKVSRMSAPVFFDGLLYERLGSESREVPKEDYMRVFSRFTAS